MKRWQELLKRKEEIGNKKITVGYDGFTDLTVRPLARSASADGPAERFETISQFGEFLISKANKSCSIELEVESRHLGGNLPFLASGAEALGLNVTGIGMLGAGGVIEDVFRGMKGSYYSYAPSGQSTCLEFRDGKVMLAPSVQLAEDPWDLVMAATGGRAPELFGEADLMALVNWSELSYSQQLWEETYRHALAGTACDKSRFAFFDLCDISRKTAAEVRAVAELIGRFGEKRTTILSLNENEAQTVGQRLWSETVSVEEIARRLIEEYRIDEVLIHTTRMSVLVNREGVYRAETDYVERPVKSTGAGDHFNAASCLAAVMGLEPVERLVLANRVAGQYVRTGRSPGLEMVVGANL